MAEEQLIENQAPKPRYRVVLVCAGVPTNEGAQAALDITEEFTKRPWHRNAVCRWNGHVLILQEENNFDPDGVALTDEFSDAISANIAGESMVISGCTQLNRLHRRVFRPRLLPV